MFFTHFELGYFTSYNILAAAICKKNPSNKKWRPFIDKLNLIVAKTVDVSKQKSTFVLSNARYCFDAVFPLISAKLYRKSLRS